MEVKASSLFESVAQAVKLKGGHIATDGFRPIRVLVFEPKKEYPVRFKDFMAWLNRQGRSPRNIIHRLKIREILGVNSELLGVMGIQVVQDVNLVRHAYVRTKNRKQGIGSKLLVHFKENAERPILIGTWATAVWAIRFYKKHGFKTVSSTETDLLLRRYWKIPERQIETSVVLADQKPGWMTDHLQEH